LREFAFTRPDARIHGQRCFCVKEQHHSYAFPTYMYSERVKLHRFTVRLGVFPRAWFTV
jgi:hypothetical protein